MDRDNNQAYVQININSLSDVDIFVTNTTMFESTSTLNFSWVLNADRPVSGYKCDSYYLSDDKNFSYNDFELGAGDCAKFHISLVKPPNETSTESFRKLFKKDYFVTDGRILWYR